jgi:hypothetical protein
MMDGPNGQQTYTQIDGMAGNGRMMVATLVGKGRAGGEYLDQRNGDEKHIDNPYDAITMKQFFQYFHITRNYI